MPTVELTEAPKLLLSPNANLAWWKIQILACSYYPAPKDAWLRSKYADKILRSHTRDWTSRICILQPAGRAYQRWIALHGYALEQDEVAGLKANEVRDLRISIEVLLQCTLEGLSKAQAFTEIARYLVEKGEANSLQSAEWTVKRAWRKYNAGCHFAAAELLVGRSEHTSVDMNQSTIDSVSFRKAEDQRREYGAHPR